MLKIRRSGDRLIFNMGILILGRQHLYIEMVPKVPFQYKDHISKYGDFHYKDKTTMRPSSLDNGKRHTGKMASLCWDGRPPGGCCNIGYPFKTHLKLKSCEIYTHNIFHRYQIVLNFAQSLAVYITAMLCAKFQMILPCSISKWCYNYNKLFWSWFSEGYPLLL